MYKKTTLDNGLRILTIPLKESKSVTVLILVKTGSKYETKEISGVSHFLEHMCFKGTEKRPLSIDISEDLDNIGGSFNAFTSQEYTGYYAKVASAHLDIALDWVSDIYLNSKFPKDELEKEKGVIIEELNMYYDQPIQHVQFLWGKLLYGDQPAGWSILGSRESIQGMTREKIVDYINKQYTAPNTVVCVAGPIENSLVVEKIKEYFSGLKKDQTMGKEEIKDEQIKANILLGPRKTDQTHLYLGVRAYNNSHPDRYVQKLLSIILGGMMSSRLFIEIREKMGAAYYVGTESSSDSDVGYLATRAGVDNKKLEEVIKTILREYKKISEEEVPSKELKKAKEYIKGKTYLSLESSDAQAAFYTNQELLEDKILSPEEIFKKIDSVTGEDILRVAKDIFQFNKLNLAMVGPSNEEKVFKEILNQWNQNKA